MVLSVLLMRVRVAAAFVAEITQSTIAIAREALLTHASRRGEIGLQWRVAIVMG